MSVQKQLSNNPGKKLSLDEKLCCYTCTFCDKILTINASIEFQSWTCISL